MGGGVFYLGNPSFLSASMDSGCLVMSLGFAEISYHGSKFVF